MNRWGDGNGGMDGNGWIDGNRGMEQIRCEWVDRWKIETDVNR